MCVYEDVDECTLDGSLCLGQVLHAACYNSLGSYYCGCLDGYRMAYYSGNTGAYHCQSMYWMGAY